MACHQFFNLVAEPWIPVSDGEGNFIYLSLEEVFVRKDIVDLSVGPMERIALMRLFLCIIYAANGVGDGADSPMLERCVAYLAKWRDRFYLCHGQYPFLQYAGLEGENKPWTTLAFSKTSGNNLVIRGNDGRSNGNDEWQTDIAARELALYLLTFQNFHGSGTAGTGTWQEEELPNAGGKSGQCKNNVHLFILKKSLEKTLLANFVPLGKLPKICNDFLGRPVWEGYPEKNFFEKNAKNAAKTFLGRLVPWSRAVLLRQPVGNGPWQVSVATGLERKFLCEDEKGDQNAPAMRGLTTTIIVQKKGGKNETVEKILKINPKKSLWRDAHVVALADYRRDRDGWSIVCAPILRPFLESPTSDYIIWCGGVAYHGRMGGAVEIAVEDHWPIGNAALRGQAEHRERFVAKAEEMAKKLGRAGAECKKGAKLSSAYWATLDVRQGLMHELLRQEMAQKQGTENGGKGQGPLERWERELQQVALAIFDDECAPQNSAQWAVYVRGRRQIFETFNVGNGDGK
ncbi:MAG: type I-E CRISPR-associated protein Cse1/CasA [Puniceicoccales bacterium]|nr:type I-E CRISPR-associated protein Cse1/CasA [Puniceicoccales bacterium]